jgi:Domain of unknown function (DUF3597)
LISSSWLAWIVASPPERELAVELKYPGDQNDSAKMNVWLHKAGPYKAIGKWREDPEGTPRLGADIFDIDYSPLKRALRGDSIPLFQRFMRMPSLLLTFATFATLVACDARPPASTETPRRENSKAVQPGNESDFRQRQMAFLNRLREADPQQRTIDRALLNEQNELGLILDRSVDIDKIPALMKTMLAQMAHEFPNQDLTVIAYAPSNPPRKIGTARLNAQTHDMTFTREH